MGGVITISCLGSKGRAGNAMFQFAFAMGYAKAMGCDLLTNDWWGRRVFPAAAALPVIDLSNLPKTHCDSVCHLLRPALPLDYFMGRTDIDLDGYYQNQKFIDFYSRKQVREWFKLSSEFEGYAPLKEQTGPYSAKHLRRGDYTNDATFQHLYCTISDESYDTAVKTFNIPPFAPGHILRVCDGGPAREIDKLRAIGVGWLPDFLVLRDADHLLRSNSTFSWWAGALGNGMVYSPVVDNKVGLQKVPFVIGNHPNTAGIFPNQSDLHLKE